MMLKTAAAPQLIKIVGRLESFSSLPLFAVLFVKCLTGARINREFEEQLQRALQDLE